ncbi:MAG: D-alanyl-D-alanine carboxypeptidase family protein [Intestinimonas sp.]
MVTPKAPVESQLLSDMHIEAAAAILVDADTGTVLFDQNAHEQRYPASITKVMTAMLAIEAVDRGELSLNDVITVGSEVNREVGDGSSTQNIKEGEQIRLEDVLYCALTASANEACNVLAQAVSGSVDDFVALMNQRAGELGMEDTHFANTHGYHNEEHYTTAYDIALMCREAMQHETFRTIVTAKSYIVPATNLHEARELHDTNALVSTWRITGYYYEYATGIKTGSTPEAWPVPGRLRLQGRPEPHLGRFGCGKHCAVRRHHSAAVLLREQAAPPMGIQQLLHQNAFGQHLFWRHHSRHALPGRQLCRGPGIGEIEAILPNDLDPADFQVTPEFNAESLEAPVDKGQIVGKVTVSNGDTVYGSLDLVAVDSVARSELLYRLDQVKRFLTSSG